MSYQDKIRQTQGNENSASFRGIPFRVRSDSNGSGRRGTTHEYIFRDKPFREDTGKAAEEIRIEAFIDGNNNSFNGQTLDYIQLRDLLRDAMINDPTPGILILPTWGEFKVAPLRIDVTTSNRTEGICRMQLTFVESGEQSFPSVRNNLPETTRIDADALTASVANEAGNGTILTKDPDGGVDESEEIAGVFTESTDIALNSGDQDQNALEEFTRKFTTYKDDLRAALFTPVDFYTDTKEAYEDLRSVWPSENQNDAFDAFRDIFNSAVDDIGKIVSIVTPDRQNQEKNSQLLRDGFRNIMLAQMSIITANQAFVSTSQVQQRRDEIAGLFDQQILNASNNFDRDQRDSLVVLRTSTLATLESVQGTLPEEKTEVLNNSVPSFVLANSLYGDSLRGREIADANEILNPLFLPPQVELRVLSS